jgi:glycolate oxidase
MTAPADGRAALADPVVADLLAALPADRVLLDAGLVAPYLRDEAVWAEHGQPRAVVRARTSTDVAATVAVCARHRAPVVPRDLNGWVP